MKIKTGSFTGNGVNRKVYCGFKPDFVIARTNSAQGTFIYQPLAWAGRTDRIGALDSAQDGITPIDDGFMIGNIRVTSAGAAIGNILNETTYWLAVQDDESNNIDFASWMGTLTDNRVITFPKIQKIHSVLVKRDSTRSGVFAAVPDLSTDAVTATKGDGTGTGTYIKKLTDSSGNYPTYNPANITIDNSNESNELNGPAGLGEGICGIAFKDCEGMQSFKYTGNGAADRVYPLYGTPIAVLIFSDGTGTTSARFKTDGMATDLAAPSTAAAIVSGQVSFSTNSLVFPAASPLNTNLAVYQGIAFFAQDTPKRIDKELGIIVKNKQAVYLPGQGTLSYVDCGISDATLKIDGAISIEWMGTVQHNGNQDFNLICRQDTAATAATTNGSWSWGLGGYPFQQSTYEWKGPQFIADVTGFWDLGNTLVDIRTMPWRTGILSPFSKPFHVVLTHNGTGTWKLYLNGYLVKQRTIDTTAINAAYKNIQSGAGHKTLLGARKSTSASTTIVNPQRMLFNLARVYAAELTAANVYARYTRAAFNATTYSDVTTSLAAEWDANNAGGALLPDTVNSANNGTIVLGNVIVQ